jgi:hypothetical protein
MSARSKTPTKRGAPKQPSTDEIPTEILGDDFPRRARAKTARQPNREIPAPPVVPAAPVIKAISMKTPGDVKREMPESEMPHVKLRAMSEVTRAQTPQNLGHLAPPYDPNEARKRSARDLAIWACVGIILACAIALVVWFAAM